MAEDRLRYDLRRMVPRHHQEPLWNFIYHGVLPLKFPELIAELSGLHDGAHEARTYLERHSAQLDIAHGHYGYMVRWSRHGGLAGRLGR